MSKVQNMGIAQTKITKIKKLVISLPIMNMQDINNDLIDIDLSDNKQQINIFLFVQIKPKCKK